MNTHIHNLTVAHCNIQGGLTSISKSTEITQLIRKYDIDVLSLNDINLGEGVDSSTINNPSSFNFIRKVAKEAVHYWLTKTWLMM